MTFLAIALALVVDRFLGVLAEWRRWDWFNAWTDWLHRRLGGYAFHDGPAGVILALAPILLGVGLLYQGLSELLGLFGFLFAAAVLLFTLGPRCLDDDVEEFEGARLRGSREAACHYADELAGGAAADADDPWGTALATRGVLTEAHERLFGTLFWFAILGPVGAVLHRLSVVLRGHVAQGGGDGGFARAAELLHAILAWPSARLLAAGYALSGHFAGAIAALRRRLLRLDADARELLVAVGEGALDQDLESLRDPDAQRDGGRPVAEAFALVRRSLVIWLAVLALMTLSGWLG
ncbi:MAG: cobalamin biosynthesis protein [Thiohalospira sp.]